MCLDRGWVCVWAGDVCVFGQGIGVCVWTGDGYVSGQGMDVFGQGIGVCVWLYVWAGDGYMCVGMRWVCM